jgi:hypothetical protein
MRRCLNVALSGMLLVLLGGCGAGDQNPNGRQTGPAIEYNKSGPGPMKGPPPVGESTLPKNLEKMK